MGYTLHISRSSPIQNPLMWWISDPVQSKSAWTGLDYESSGLIQSISYSASDPVSRRGEASIRPLQTVQISPGYSPWFGLRLIANDAMSGPWPQTDKQTDAPSLTSYLDLLQACAVVACRSWSSANHRMTSHVWRRYLQICSASRITEFQDAGGKCGEKRRNTHVRCGAQTPQSQSSQCINWIGWKVSIILAIRLFKLLGGRIFCVGVQRLRSPIYTVYWNTRSGLLPTCRSVLERRTIAQNLASIDSNISADTAVRGPLSVNNRCDSSLSCQWRFNWRSSRTPLSPVLSELISAARRHHHWAECSRPAWTGRWGPSRRPPTSAKTAPIIAKLYSFVGWHCSSVSEMITVC